MDPHSFFIRLQPVTASTASLVRAFAAAGLQDSPYAEPLLAAFDGALAGESDEYRAIAAWHHDAVVGLGVFGETAGAVGAGRIYLIAVDASVRERGVAAKLLEAVCSELAARGARFAMIELPGEPRFAPVRRLAERLGFRERGRLDDYHRDGVPLILLRRELVAAPTDPVS